MGYIPGKRLKFNRDVISPVIRTLDFRLETSGLFKPKTNPCRFVWILSLHDMLGLRLHSSIGFFLGIFGHFLRGLVSEVYGLWSDVWRAIEGHN